MGGKGLMGKITVVNLEKKLNSLKKQKKNWPGVWGKFGYYGFELGGSGLGVRL